MSTGKNDSSARPRGRPRSAAAREAVLRAAREMLEEGGLTAITMEGLAARSGISKPTIYRSWKNSHAVAMEAFLESASAQPAPRRSSSAILALRAQLYKVIETFTSTTGRSVAAMVAAAQSETELAKAFRNHFILASREEGRRLLESAVAQGDLKPGFDFEVTLDLIYAPLYFRLLMGHAKLTREFADALLDQVVSGTGAGKGKGPRHR